MLNFSVCVCGGGGGGQGANFVFVVVAAAVVVVVVLNAFSNSELAKHQIVLLPNKQNLEEYFHRQHF